MFCVLNCPFNPDNPYGLDKIAWNGRNNTNQIYDLNSCNENFYNQQYRIMDRQEVRILVV